MKAKKAKSNPQYPINKEAVPPFVALCSTQCKTPNSPQTKNGWFKEEPLPYKNQQFRSAVAA
jgi:hypothetical protein